MSSRMWMLPGAKEQQLSESKLKEEQTLIDVIVKLLEARDLTRMMFLVIMELPGGKELLLRYLAGDELPKWVMERPKRVRKRR